MGTQAAMIMETIMGMKRVIDPQDDSSDSEEPYLRPPNWGNKLKRKAKFSLDGRPVKKVGRATYAKTIEHAGHQRAILRRNPRRYDEDGEELGSEDEDEEADARAAEENPYAEVHLDTLMVPLTSATNLANHPSLSAPYLSSTLTNMAQHASDTIHRERKTLRSAKLLLRKLRGDEVWIPTGLLNCSYDKDIFDTEKVYNTIVAETVSSRSKRSTPVVDSSNEDIISRTVSGSVHGEIINSVEAIAVQEKNLVKEATQKFTAEDSDNDAALNKEAELITHNQAPGHINKVDPEEEENPVEATAEKDQDDEAVDVIGPETTADQHPPIMNGVSPAPEPGMGDERGKSKPAVNSAADAEMGQPSERDVSQERINGHTSPAPDAMDEDDDTNQAPIPRRMRTRAQAAATSEPAISPQTTSPEPPYVPPPIHPLFLLPALAKSEPDYGLSPQEGEETRRMLMIYVQKQEEVCRSAEKLYQNLLRADRERNAVLNWCKAEGHVGEMSDGEDWCDKDEWGLEEDLRKGEGDEKDGDEGNVKKTRGRRA